MALSLEGNKSRLKEMNCTAAKTTILECNRRFFYSKVPQNVLKTMCTIMQQISTYIVLKNVLQATLLRVIVLAARRRISVFPDAEECENQKGCHFAVNIST